MKSWKRNTSIECRICKIEICKSESKSVRKIQLHKHMRSQHLDILKVCIFDREVSSKFLVFCCCGELRYKILQREQKFSRTKLLQIEQNFLQVEQKMFKNENNCLMCFYLHFVSICGFRDLTRSCMALLWHCMAFNGRYMVLYGHLWSFLAVIDPD